MAKCRGWHEMKGIMEIKKNWGWLPFFVVSCIVAPLAAAYTPDRTVSAARSSAIAQLGKPVLIATTTGPGQAGYVHYFIIKKPDETLETQIGIEMPDQRIAWSFFDLGVVVSPFMDSGSKTVNGKTYEVQHLYALRPFADDAAMLAFQAKLESRVIPWVEDATPYCELKVPSGELCLSCLGFVTHILFPGQIPGYPALPRDFPRSGEHYSTEDLLLYLTGLHGLPTPKARHERINKLALPQNLQQELVRLVNLMDTNSAAGVASTAATRKPSGKSRGARAVAKTEPQRPRQPRKI